MQKIGPPHCLKQVVVPTILPLVAAAMIWAKR